MLNLFVLDQLLGAEYLYLHNFKLINYSSTRNLLCLTALSHTMGHVVYLSSINPIACGYESVFQANVVKSQMQHNPIFPIHLNFAHSWHRARSLGDNCFRICHKKPYIIFGNTIATKAVKTDNHDVPSFADEENTIDLDWVDENDEGSPWEGAIVYRRNPSISHVEFCTTLERLGLGKLSSDISRSRASTMGLRITKAVKDYLQGTPVLVSVDVTRKKHKLRLDGILRTVISLACNRCGSPAAENVFSNFSLLLTEEPIEEPEVTSMGVIYGEDKAKSSADSVDEEDDEDEASIDLDDRLYFPPEEKEIDISKHIRDMIHIEITINAVCDPKCKGLCLNCGTNLNTGNCKCSKNEVDDVGYGPLGDLRKQMQHK